MKKRPDSRVCPWYDPLMITPEPAIGLENISVYSRGPRLKPGSLAMEDTRMAALGLTLDVSSLFPYLNAVAPNAELHGECIRFSHNKTECVLYARWCVFTPVNDRREARKLALELLDYLNAIQQKKKEIAPRHGTFEHKPVPRILKLLPLNNCGECGFPTCLAFAANLGKDRAVAGECPYMAAPERETAIFTPDPKNPEETLVLNMGGTGRRLRSQSARIRAQADRLAELTREVDRLSQLGQATRDQANQALPSPLTRREIQVLRFLARGDTNGDIARELAISAHTVKSHVLHIFNKLGVNDRTQAAVWAARNRFV